MDFKLIEALGKFGYLTTRQIEKHIYKRSNRNTLKRLQLLRLVGFIKPARQTDDKGTRVWIPLMEECYYVLDKWDRDIAVKLVSFKPWRWSAVTHEELVREYALRVMNLFPDCFVDTGLAIELQKGGFRRLKMSEYRKLPDFALDNDEMKISFEIELHPKSSAHYYKIMRQLLARSRNGCIYLVNNQATKNKIHKCIAVFKERAAVNKEPIFENNLAIFRFDEVADDSVLSFIIQKMLGQQVGAQLGGVCPEQNPPLPNSE
jgi:hypothetical protein